MKRPNLSSLKTNLYKKGKKWYNNFRGEKVKDQELEISLLEEAMLLTLVIIIFLSTLMLVGGGLESDLKDVIQRFLSLI